MRNGFIQYFMTETKQKKKNIKLAKKKSMPPRLRVAEQQTAYNAETSSAQIKLPLDSIDSKSKNDLLNIKEAAEWASKFLGKNVTTSICFKKGTL